MVYVVTAGSGESYRVERLCLESDQAHEFAQDYNGTAPIGPVQDEEYQVGAPPPDCDGPSWWAQWRARIPAAKGRTPSCGTPTRANGSTTTRSVTSGGPGMP
jgi:hypothetical protein